jgi:molecular chaperone DnaK
MDDEVNEVLCRMRLDLDGILEVTAVEKCTGKSKHITISGTLPARTAEEIAAGRKRIQELYGSRSEAVDLPEENVETAETIRETKMAAGAVSFDNPVAAPGPAISTDRESMARDLIERSRRLFDILHADDREEAIGLHEAIQAAIQSGDAVALDEASRTLKELLFFSEGQS